MNPLVVLAAIALPLACSHTPVIGGAPARAAVVGRCVDASGAPLANVRVRWTRNLPALESDSGGRFRLEATFDPHLARFQSALVFEPVAGSAREVKVELRDKQALDLGDVVLDAN